MNRNFISFEAFEHSEDFVLLYTQGPNEFTPNPFVIVGFYSAIEFTGMGSDTFKVKTSIVKLTPLCKLKHGT